jgi:uncharacterized protein YjeT (DUF2065 family)
LAWADILAGFAIYLVLEGLLPFASPQTWRKGLAALAGLPDAQLRAFGLGVAIAGVVLLFVVRSL